SCSSSPRCWGVSSSPPELDLNLFNVPGEFERHLRVVFVDDWCSGILTDVETFIEGELADRRSVLDAAFRNFLAIDHEGAEATFAEPAAVDILGLAEIIGEIVEFPLVVVGVPCSAAWLPRQPRWRGARAPA